MMELSTAFALIALAIAVLAAVWARRASDYSASCYRYVEESNKRSVTIKKLTEIEVELTEHADSIASILKSMHKLRSRIHARTMNANRTPTGAPDPNTDPDAWKRHMNAQLAHKQREG